MPPVTTRSSSRPYTRARGPARPPRRPDTPALQRRHAIRRPGGVGPPPTTTTTITTTAHPGIGGARAPATVRGSQSPPDVSDLSAAAVSPHPIPAPEPQATTTLPAGALSPGHDVVWETIDGAQTQGGYNLEMRSPGGGAASGFDSEGSSTDDPGVSGCGAGPLPPAPRPPATLRRPSVDPPPPGLAVLAAAATQRWLTDYFAPARQIRIVPTQLMYPSDESETLEGPPETAPLPAASASAAAAADPSSTESDLPTPPASVRGNKKRFASSRERHEAEERRKARSPPPQFKAFVVADPPDTPHPGRDRKRRRCFSMGLKRGIKPGQTALQLYEETWSSEAEDDASGAAAARADATSQLLKDTEQAKADHLTRLENKASVEGGVHWTDSD